MDFGVAALVASAGLVAIPVLAWRLGRRAWPTFRHSILGATAGAVVTPLSVCLYLQFFTDPIRALLLGFPGLFLMALHLGPGHASLASHEIVVDGGPGFLSVMNGISWMRVVSWAAVYAAIGAALDFRSSKRREAIALGAVEQ